MNNVFQAQIDLALIKLYQNQLNDLIYEFNSKYHGTPIDFTDEWLKENYPNGDHSFQIQKVLIENGLIEIEYDYIDSKDEDIHKDSMAFEQFFKYAK